MGKVAAALARRGRVVRVDDREGLARQQHELAGISVFDRPGHEDLAAGRPKALGVARADRTMGDSVDAKALGVANTSEPSTAASAAKGKGFIDLVRDDRTVTSFALPSPAGWSGHDRRGVGDFDLAEVSATLARAVEA